MSRGVFRARSCCKLLYGRWWNVLSALSLAARKGSRSLLCLRQMTNDKGQMTSAIDLAVRLGRLTLPNPILVASGTFGYAREMVGFVDLKRLGGIIPKTITRQPRVGNAPWRTIETTGGMLNSIGLDNDGQDAFIEHHLPYLATVGSPIIVSIAG